MIKSKANGKYPPPDAEVVEVDEDCEIEEVVVLLVVVEMVVLELVELVFDELEVSAM